MTMTVIDRRTPPVQNDVATVAERVPLGAFVAYAARGESVASRGVRHAIVHGHENDVVVLLDGATLVTVAGADLADVRVLGTSADDYAQRVSREARRLARQHGWCDVAERTIEELNRTSVQEHELTELHVITTSTDRRTLRLTQWARRQLRDRHNGDVTALLRATHRGRYGDYDADYFTVNRGIETSVTIEVIDPPAGDGAGDGDVDG